MIHKRFGKLAGFLFGFFFLASSCFGAFYIAQALGRSLRGDSGSAITPTEFNCHGLVVSNSELDLADVWQSTEFVHDLSIRNITQVEKKIDQFATSCLCTSVEPRSLTIPPGNEAKVHVRIDPNHQRSPDSANLATRPFAVEVKPIMNGVSIPNLGWRIHGQLKSRVTFGVLSVHFGQEVVQGELSPTRKVPLAVHVQAESVKARINPSGVGSVSVIPNQNDPTGLELLITPANTLPVGPFKASVYLDVVNFDGTVVPAGYLPIAGNVQPEARLLPAVVMLGTHPVGSMVETIVALQAPTKAEWKVDHIETDSSNVTVIATEANGISAGRAFRVRQNCIREGSQKDTIRFFLRKEGGAPTKLVMEVVSLGVLHQPVMNPKKGNGNHEDTD